MSFRDSARNSAWRIIRRRRPADLVPAGPASGITSTAVALVEPEPVATQPEPPEVTVNGRVYFAQDHEPGQTTTAIGHHDAGLLRDRSIDGETTVIGRYGVEQKAARDVQDPPLYRRLVAELHRHALEVQQQQRRAAETPAAADDLQPGDYVCTCDEPLDEEDRDGDAVLLPRIDLDGGKNRG